MTIYKVYYTYYYKKLNFQSIERVLAKSVGLSCFLPLFMILLKKYRKTIIIIIIILEYNYLYFKMLYVMLDILK